MMAILDKLLKRREVKVERADMEKQQLIADCLTILKMIRGSFANPRELCWHDFRLRLSRLYLFDDEERIMRALEHLRSKHLLNWGGHVGDTVSYNLRNIPDDERILMELLN